MNLKFILLSIFTLLLIFIAFGFYKSSSLKQIHITKRVTINSSLENTFNMVKYLSNFPKWSPFLKQDPTQKYQVKGTDGEVGAQYHWEGNNGKDLGYQEIAKIENLKRILMKCDIQKPFVAQPEFNYTFNSTNNGVEVVQDFKLTSGAVDAFFMWIFGAKTEMENTNAQGLQLLKQALEQS